MLPFSCRKANQPPFASLEAFPAIGDTSILFEFDAGASEDDRDYPIGLMYRWDLNEDGVYDTGFTHHKTVTNRFRIPGTHTIRVEVTDIDGLSSVAEDSVMVFGENLDVDTLLDPRDGRKYKIVKIQDHWWMAENLRYGVEIPTSRNQTDNDTVEMYIKHSGSVFDTTGGVYSWFEALEYRIKDTKGICPDQWHLPTAADWQTLFDPYPRLYSVRYFGKEGLSGLNLDLNNGGFMMEHTYFWESYLGFGTGFWSSSSKVEESEYLPYHVGFNSAIKFISLAYWGNSGLDRYYSVRCIKDK